MKLAFLATDNREQQKRYDLEMPFFDAAQTALLEGFRSMPEEIEVHVISCSKRTMSGPSKLADNIHFHQPVVPHLGWGRTAFAGCALAVRRLLMHLKPDIVHGQGTERDCAISAVYSGFPNVLTIHGNMRQLQHLRLLGSFMYSHLASLLESHSLHRTSGVYCNSEYTRSLVAPRTRRTWLVPNAIRGEFFGTAQVSPISDMSPRLLNVGWIQPRKRQMDILQAIGDLARMGYPIHITFAGQLKEHSSYGKQFLAALRNAEAAGYASYVGFKDLTDLIHLMDQSHGFVHFPEEEAFGLVVAEALARNLKVFAARVGGIPDILGGTDGSEMFDDFDGLRLGVENWLKAGCPHPSGNPVLMRERYAPDVIARRHLEIYREVLGK